MAKQNQLNRIILVGSEKGGVGKTSLSFNLAVLRAKAGKPILLVDSDKQASSAMWASMRTEAGHSPALVCVQKLGKIGSDLIELRKNYEVIVDAGGADSTELRQAIAVADIWLIPVRTGQLDLFSIAKMRKLHAEVEERVGRAPKTYIVLNAVAASTHEAEEARELLADDESILVMDSQLVDRVAMRRSVMAGCGVIELPPKMRSEAATEEILALYNEVFGEPYYVA